jgi:hypothetical protein
MGVDWGWRAEVAGQIRRALRLVARRGARAGGTQTGITRCLVRPQCCAGCARKRVQKSGLAYDFLGICRGCVCVRRGRNTGCCCALDACGGGPCAWRPWHLAPSRAHAACVTSSSRNAWTCAEHADRAANQPFAWCFIVNPQRAKMKVSPGLRKVCRRDGWMLTNQQWRAEELTPPAKLAPNDY